MKRTMTAVAALLISATAAQAQDTPQQQRARAKAQAEAQAPAPKPARAAPSPAAQPRPGPANAAPRLQPAPASGPRAVSPAFVPRQPMNGPMARPEQPVDRSFANRQRPAPAPRPVRAAPAPAPVPAMTDRPDRPARADRTVRPDRSADLPPGAAAGPARQTGFNRPDRPARTPPSPSRTDPGAARPNKTPGFGRSNGPGAERPTRPDRPNRPTAAGHDRTGRADLPTRPQRPGPGMAHPDRTGRPDRVQRFDPVRSRQIRQQLRTRPAARTNWSYRVGDRRLRVVRASPYRYPGGYRYRVWRRGQRFPAALLIGNYLLNNYYAYDLGAPPSGYRWYRFGPDAVLVNASTMEVDDTRYGVFYEGAPQTGYDDSANLPAIDPSLPETFLTGELDLQAYGGSCDDFYGDGELQGAIDDAWRDEDWNGLAGLVLQGGCQTDLSYYLLGLAAEGLVLPDAAASYYQRALDLSTDTSFQDNCEAWGDAACRDLYIDDEAAAGLERIYGGEDGDRQ